MSQISRLGTRIGKSNERGKRICWEIKVNEAFKK